MTSLGFVVATVGLVIVAVGVVGVNVVFFQHMPKMMERRSAALAHRREGRGVAQPDQELAHEFVIGLTLCAAIAGFGLTAMLEGLVVAGSLVNWAPLMPLAFTLIALAAAVYSGWSLRRIRNG
jgi:lysylphosphatidylglycerol synthetase-like protein (DUF2156 family)